MFRFFIALSMLSALTAQASIAEVVANVEIEKHIEKMEDKGFKLSNIKDVHASEGLVPRCRSDFYEFTYSKSVSRAGERTMQHKKFNVNTECSGAEHRLRVHEVR